MTRANSQPFSIRVLDATAIEDLVSQSVIARSAQSSAVVMWGQGFVRGDLPASAALQLNVDGSDVPVQISNVATWGDGTVRFAVLAAPVGSLTAGQEKPVVLRRGGASPTGTGISLNNLPSHNLSWSSPGASVSGTPSSLSFATLFAGPHAAAFRYRVQAANGLFAFCDIYAYRTASSGAVDRVEYAGGWENIDIRASGSADVQGDFSFSANGQTIVQGNGRLYWCSRFVRQALDTSVVMRWNPTYLAAAGLVLGYRDSWQLTNGTRSSFLNAASTGFNSSGWWRDYMKGGGEDPDIGPISAFDASVLLTGDLELFDTMLEQHLQQGRAPIHGFDLSIGSYVRFGTASAGGFPTNGNLNPDFGVYGFDASSSYGNDWGIDNAHQPSLGYIPYLLTGRPVFLDEHLFWATGAALGNSSGWGGAEYPIFVHEQMRADAWALRTVATAWAVVPDSDAPLKAYLIGCLQYNYDVIWTVGHAPGQTANSPLGIYSTQYPRSRTNINGDWHDNYIIPWMQDFVAITAAWAYKLGLDGSGSTPNFLPFAQYLCSYKTDSVSRADGFGPQASAQYWMEVGSTHPTTWPALKSEAYSRAGNSDDSSPWRPASFIASADRNALATLEYTTQAWRDAWGSTVTPTTIVAYWLAGSDALITKAALAVAVDVGLPDARASFDTYTALDLPDTTELGGPQFDLAPIE